MPGTLNLLESPLPKRSKALGKPTVSALLNGHTVVLSSKSLYPWICVVLIFGQGQLLCKSHKWSRCIV